MQILENENIIREKCGIKIKLFYLSCVHEDHVCKKIKKRGKCVRVWFFFIKNKIIKLFFFVMKQEFVLFERKWDENKKRKMCKPTIT